MRQRALGWFASVMLFGLLFLIGGGVVGSSAPMAQQPPPAASPPGSAPKSFLPPVASRPGGAAPVTAAPTGFYGWVTSLQHGYNQRLARAIRDLKSSNPMLAVLSLAGLSFAYGVLHAAGPGHGKAVITSYVLASQQTVRRGIALSFLAALFQAISALILVAILIYGLSATGLAIKTTEAWLETLSWALVAIIGAWLLWRQVREWRAERAALAHSHGHHELHHHDHGHDHAHAAPGHVHGPACNHGHDHHHAPSHTHQHDACCDHAHLPDPKQLEGVWSWRKATLLAAAIGIRPCTGAIQVLVFAILQGLAWAGVFATFAMALGTAITVSALATSAIGSRELAARLGGERGSGWADGVRRLAGVGGSLAVLILGVMLFFGSLGPATGI
ncbi:MAG: nickel/cobalt transporter [Hyphomicrobiaceae bacterium]